MPFNHTQNLRSVSANAAVRISSVTIDIFFAAPTHEQQNLSLFPHLLVPLIHPHRPPHGPQLQPKALHADEHPGQ